MKKTLTAFCKTRKSPKKRPTGPQTETTQSIGALRKKKTISRKISALLSQTNIWLAQMTKWVLKNHHTHNKNTPKQQTNISTRFSFLFLVTVLFLTEKVQNCTSLLHKPMKQMKICSKKNSKAGKSKRTAKPPSVNYIKRTFWTPPWDSTKIPKI